MPGFTLTYFNMAPTSKSCVASRCLVIPAISSSSP